MKEDAPGTAEIPDKFYFKIGEVSEIVGVAAYVLRFWETEFKQIKPKRTPSGQRAYRKQDVALLLRIKHLLYDRKFTIEGARQRLRHKAGGSAGPARADGPLGIAEIRAELIRIRKLLEDYHR